MIKKQETRPFITNCNGVHHLYAFSGLRINLVVFSIEEMQAGQIYKDVVLSHRRSVFKVNTKVYMDIRKVCTRLSSSQKVTTKSPKPKLKDIGTHPVRVYSPCLFLSGL